jgi:hypothetical protein
VDQRLCAWLAVLVLPVNSALNPVLYTLTTSFFKSQVTSIPSPPLLICVLCCIITTHRVTSHKITTLTGIGERTSDTRR